MTKEQPMRRYEERVGLKFRFLLAYLEDEGRGFLGFELHGYETELRCIYLCRETRNCMDPMSRNRKICQA